MSNIDFSRENEEVLDEKELEAKRLENEKFINDVKSIANINLIMPEYLLIENYGLNKNQIKIMQDYTILEQAIYLTFHTILKMPEVRDEVSKLVTIDALSSKNDVFETVKSLSPEMIEEYMKFSQDGDDTDELRDKTTKLSNLIRNYTTFHYIKLRDTLFKYRPNYQYSKEDFTDSQESIIIDNMINKYFNSNSPVGKALDNVARMPGLEYTWKEMNLDTRKRLEILKDGMINGLGYTEESVEAYLQAKFKYINDQFDKGVYANRDEAKYDNSNEAELRKLLVKDEEWVKTFKETGKRLKKYKSEMLDAIIKHDVKPIEDLMKENPNYKKDEGWEFLQMAEHTKQILHDHGLENLNNKLNIHVGSVVNRSNPKANGRNETYSERKRRERMEAKKSLEIKEKSNVVPQTKVDYNPQLTPLEELRRRANEAKLEEPKEVKIEESTIEKPIELKPEVKPKIKEEVKVETKVNPYVVDEVNSNEEKELELQLIELKKRELELKLELSKKKKSTPVEVIENSIPNEVEVVKVKNIPEIPTDKDLNIEVKEYKPEVVEEALNKINDIVENKEVDPKYFINRAKEENIKNNVDAYALNPEFKKEADISILRNVHNPVERVRLYRESERVGRSMFLPNSGYEIKICKLANKEQLSMILRLIKNDMASSGAIDQLVTDECLNILYGSIEFPFSTPVSKTDFLKCLHPNDMILAMIMLAIVNTAPDKDGRVLLEINSLICSSEVHQVQEVFNLKKSFTIDLLEEFQKLYKVSETLLKRRSNFVTSEYKTIFDAYTKNGVGKSRDVLITDDMGMAYRVLVSPTNQYKQIQQRQEIQRVVYDTLKNEFKMEENTSTVISLKTKVGRDFDIVKDYIENSTYDNFVSDGYELDGLSLRDFNNRYDEYPEDLRAEALIEQADKKDRWISLKVLYRLIAEYLSTMSEIIILLDFIEGIWVYDRLDELIAGPITHEDYPSLVQIFSQIQDIKPILDCITELDKVLEPVIESYRVEYDSSVLRGYLPDFEAKFLSEGEYVESLKEKNIGSKQVELMLEEYKLYRTNMNESRCWCGSTKFHLDWRSIVFHSLSKTFPDMIL